MLRVLSKIVVLRKDLDRHQERMDKTYESVFAGVFNRKQRDGPFSPR